MNITSNIIANTYFRWGNEGEEAFYDKGIMPFKEGRSPHFAGSLIFANEYKEHIQKGKTQSKGNKLNTLYQLVLDNDKGICPVHSKKICKSIFWLESNPPKVLKVLVLDRV